MINRRLGIYGAMSAFAFVGGVVAGCGGSSSVQAPAPDVPVTGGLATAPATGPATGVAASNQPQQIPVTQNGTTTTAILPANEAIPPGGPVSVLPSTPDTPLITGLSYGPGTARQAVPSSGKTVKPMTTGAQGEVDVDGVNTTDTVTSGGWLSSPLALDPGQHVITAWGPWVLSGSSSTGSISGTLNVSYNVSFTVTVDNNGNVSFPSNLTGNLPGNGGAIKNGPNAVLTYPSAFLGGASSLTLAWPGGQLNQTKPVINGTVTFRAFTNPAEIPRDGLSTVQFVYIP